MSDSLPAPAPARSVRFSLWELLVLVTLVCLTGGALAWTREAPEAFLFFVAGVFGTLVFGIHAVTRRPWLSIAAAAGIIFTLGCLLLPATRSSPKASRRMMCSNHLKQIALALQNYHDTYSSFPPAYLADASGKPIHSWRVLILPFMENKPLYDKYSFAEPWDGPNNRLLHNEVIHAYTCPMRNRRQPHTETSYVAVVGPGTVWPGSTAMKVSDVTDSTFDTLLVVETVGSGIHWMEPRDLDLATMPLVINSKPAPSISSDHPNVALAAFVDGHTQALTKNTPTSIVQGLLTIAGGETIGDY